MRTLLRRARRRLRRLLGPVPPEPQSPIHDPVPLFVPPGHFYSPIPSWDDVRRGFSGHPLNSLPGIDLRTGPQLALLRELASDYETVPFQRKSTFPVPDERGESCRYHYENAAFSFSDGIFLFLLLRKFRPRRVVEVGSGYSSWLMLDVRDRFPEIGRELTFVEPNPELLLERVRESDDHTLLRHPVQEVDLDVFTRLEANDVLFADSSHVGKVGSDVNHLLFEVFPRLQPGVLVHVHDQFWPFEYPRRWAEEGRAWNETYLLRALLTDNSRWEILIWNQYLWTCHRAELEELMPLCREDPGGSLWLRRVG